MSSKIRTIIGFGLYASGVIWILIFNIYPILNSWEKVWRSDYVEDMKSGVIRYCPNCKKENETTVAITSAVRCSECDYLYTQQELADIYKPIK